RGPEAAGCTEDECPLALEGTSASEFVDHGSPDDSQCLSLFPPSSGGPPPCSPPGASPVPWRESPDDGRPYTASISIDSVRDGDEKLSARWVSTDLRKEADQVPRPRRARLVDWGWSLCACTACTRSHH